VSDTGRQDAPPATEPPAAAPASIARVSMIVMTVAIVVIILLRVLMTRAPSVALPVMGQVPAFELIDQTGTLVSSGEFADKIWVASFIYTTCPGPCPRVVARLGQLERHLAGEANFRIASFSVDPQADTPEVLAAYAKTHAIMAARWKLLTGPVETVMKVIRDGFLLPVQRAEGLDDEALAEVGPVIHSVRLVLVDGDGRIRGYYDSSDAGDMDRLAHETIRLLRGRRS
jgi:protein SCO1/2